MADLILVAASGLAREAIEAVTAARSHHVIGIVDDDAELHGRQYGGVTVLGGLEEINRFPQVQLLVCTGSGPTRRRIVRRLAVQGVNPSRFATVIHPSVQVPDSCTIGAGSVLLAQVALTTEVRIGRHVIVMPNVTLTHDDAVGDFATICAGVSLAGMVTVSEGAYLGSNASVREFAQIGVDAVLGMGAVLLSDLPDGEAWAGVPARELDRKPIRLSVTRPLRESS